MAKSFFGVGGGSTFGGNTGWAQYTDSQHTLASPLSITQDSEVAPTVFSSLITYSH